MPMIRSRYPKDWKVISARIRFDRAKGRCEWCGALNGSAGYRNRAGEYIQLWEDWHDAEEWPPDDGCRPVRIVLTVAHIDHDTMNNSDKNLAALCQRCHLCHDAKHHAANAAKTRDRKRGQRRLFE